MRGTRGHVFALASIVLASCSDAPAISPAPDAAVAGCGNGAVDTGEVCDGGTAECAALGASWTSGVATCRASCRGWDVSACTLASPGSFETVKPAERDAAFATARCNDGTPFDFHVRLAPGGSREWVILLEGGVYCDDATLLCSDRAAKERYRITTSSTDRALEPIPQKGILSVDPDTNPRFATANLVHAHYCSSDFWSGTTTERRPSTGDPASGWYFSGRANVQALFAMLAQRYGLDDGDPALRVLFGGTSAGAFGAHFNLAHAAEVLPATRAGGRLFLFLDAGWMVDWDDPSARIFTATVRDREVWRGARTFWAGRFDPACEAAASDPMDCWFGPGWYPHVSRRVPVLVQQSSLDASFGIQLHALEPGKPSARAWREQLTSSLAGVDRLFSGSTPYHVLSTDDATWTTTGPAGSKLRDVVGRFFDAGPAERVVF